MHTQCDCIHLGSTWEASLQTVHCPIRNWEIISPNPASLKYANLELFQMFISLFSADLIFTSSLQEICVAGQTSPPVSSVLCEYFIVSPGDPRVGNLSQEAHRGTTVYFELVSLV